MEMTLRLPQVRRHPLGRGFGDFQIAGDPTIHPGCDPFDTACIEALLRAQGAALCSEPGKLDAYGNVAVCYGQPGYAEYVAKTDAQQRALWQGFQPDYVLPDGRHVGEAEYSAYWRSIPDPQAAALRARQVAAGMIPPTSITSPAPSSSTVERLAKTYDESQSRSEQPAGQPGSASQPFVMPEFLSKTVIVGGSSFPMVAILAAGALALYLFTRSR